MRKREDGRLSLQSIFKRQKEKGDLVEGRGERGANGIGRDLGKVVS